MISDQFKVKLQIPSWVEKELSTIPSLLNKSKIPLGCPYQVPSFWMIGPNDSKTVEDKPRLFLYGTIESGSFESRILSINPVRTPKRDVVIWVECETGLWYQLNSALSASSMAKVMDMLLAGACTSLPLISSDVIFEWIEEGRKRDRSG